MARSERSGGGCGGVLLILALLLGAVVGGFLARDRLGALDFPTLPVPIPTLPGGGPPPEVGVHPAPSPTPVGRPGPGGPLNHISQPPPTQPAFGASACDDIPDGGPVGGPDCVTAEIHCGDTVVGHTRGGVDRYDTRFYESKFCWPATMDHDGGDERVYRLVMPEGDWRAWVDLHTPCADLDVAGIRYDHDTCPTSGELINQCEMVPLKGTASERIELTSRSANGRHPVWYVVVEGKDDEEGAFSLQVTCAPGLLGPLE
ncbi:MAG: hypothetical protein H6737_23215 [Alphaproteobacteria bacterium]|nr:hypothetical protein [Alphaproteobacteria bacterium]